MSHINRAYHEEPSWSDVHDAATQNNTEIKKAINNLKELKRAVYRSEYTMREIDILIKDTIKELEKCLN